jgi:hypothetical protein
VLPGAGKSLPASGSGAGRAVSSSRNGPKLEEIAPWQGWHRGCEEVKQRTDEGDAPLNRRRKQETAMKNSTQYGLFILVTLGAVLASGCMAGDSEDPSQGTDQAEEAGDEDIGEVSEALSYNGHDYLFFAWMRTMVDAEGVCTRAGYHLATINDYGENTWIVTEGSRRGLSALWIGYNDQSQEGVWKWVDGTPKGYTRWAVGEPNNGPGANEDCVELKSDAYWNDVNCGLSRSFVCEAEASPPTQTFPSYSDSNTESATFNTVNHDVYLSAGQVITVGTCGLQGSSSTGDTFLRLFQGAGMVALNDDACGGSGSNFSFFAPWSTTYTIRQGCYGNTACSGTVAYFIK